MNRKFVCPLADRYEDHSAGAGIELDESGLLLSSRRLMQSAMSPTIRFAAPCMTLRPNRASRPAIALSVGIGAMEPVAAGTTTMAAVAFTRPAPTPSR
jgi:hypothetical protein